MTASEVSVLSCAVVLQSYQVTAVDGAAPLGQTAVLTCHVPDHVRATVRVISWSVSDRVNVYPTLLGGQWPGERLLPHPARRSLAG